MKYRIAICDDNEIDRKYVLTLVSSWSTCRGFQVDVDTYTSAENYLFNHSEKGDYDILLLDIEMQKMDGVELAKLVRKENDSVQIVFITGYSDYILDGYEVAALHYLMKPVHREKLFDVLDRAIYKLGKNEKVLTFDFSGEIVRVPMYKIRYAEVFGNYVTIHAHIDIKIKMTLSTLEAELDDRFYRVGRSFIVNLCEVSRVTKTQIKLSDGSLISVPRGAYDGINRAIINMG